MVVVLAYLLIKEQPDQVENDDLVEEGMSPSQT